MVIFLTDPPQYYDKTITCMDVITHHFNDAEGKCMTNYTAISNIDPKVYEARDNKHREGKITSGCVLLAFTSFS
jgi:hypothetical protein